MMCRWCAREIEQVDGVWIDPNATGDDEIWRETCDAHDTIHADHERMRPLNEIMDFDHVIEVREDGAVWDRPDIFAPELYDEILSPESGWTLLNGWSGQDRYSGPIMHASEYIGGRMESWILANPGIYVALVAYYTPEDEDDDDVGGWAVAVRDVEDN